MRILVISHMYPNKMNPNYGIFIHNQTKHIMQVGCQITVIAPVPYAPKLLWFKSKWKNYGKVPSFDIIDEVPVHYPRYLNLPGKWFHKLSYLSIYNGIKQKIDNEIRQFRPHIIHAHTATPSGYVGLKLSKKHGLPFVCSLRGSDINVYPHYDWYTMFCTKQVISSADQIISVSGALKEAAERLESPKRAIRTIYNGCNLQHFSLSAEDRKRIRKQYNISEKGKVIIFVGEIKKNKGIYELINALKHLTPKYRHLHAFIIGDGPELSNLKEEIHANKLNKRVLLTGSQPHNEISKWLSASDIFVLPTYYEGLPNAVLEAMACELAVIATQVGGIPEIVQDRQNGILIDSKNADSLTSAIELLINNEGLSKKMGNAGRQTIEQKFSWKQNAEEMIGIYYSALNANK